MTSRSRFLDALPVVHSDWSASSVCSVEKKEVALKKMMATVLKDKGKIEGTITELDRYKRDALRTTWEKVNG